MPPGTGMRRDGGPRKGQALRRTARGERPAARAGSRGIEAPGSAFVCWLVSLHTALAGSADFLKWNFLFSPLWLVSWLFVLSSAANRKSPTHSPPTPSRSGLSACSAGFGTREAMGCIDWFLSQRTVAQESNPGTGSPGARDPGSPGSRARSSRALAPRSRAPGRLRSRAGAPGMAAW